MAAKKKPIILDTDMSPDSWAALLYLAKHSSVDLKAVSISGTGETHAKVGARNAQRLLALAGRADVPVAFGRSKPLAGSEHFPLLMRWIMDKLFWIDASKLSSYTQQQDSVDLICRVFEQSKQTITVAAVGPQTNMAQVLQKCPDLKAKLAGIYIMGGALDVPGNIREVAFWKKNEVAEWNTFCDPMALQVVFTSGISVWLVPLDATNQVPVTLEYIERFEKACRTEQARFTLTMFRRFVNRLNQGYYLWDPMTCAVAVDPTLAQFEDRRLEVVVQPGSEWGRIKPSQQGTPVHVAKQIDKRRFETGLMDVLNRT